MTLLKPTDTVTWQSEMTLFQFVQSTHKISGFTIKDLYVSHKLLILMSLGHFIHY